MFLLVFKTSIDNIYEYLAVKPRIFWLLRKMKRKVTFKTSIAHNDEQCFFCKHYVFLWENKKRTDKTDCYCHNESAFRA